MQLCGMHSHATTRLWGMAAAHAAPVIARASSCIAYHDVCLGFTVCDKHVPTGRCDRPLLIMPFSRCAYQQDDVSLQGLTTCRRPHRRSRWTTTTFWLPSTMRCWRCACGTSHYTLTQLHAVAHQHTCLPRRSPSRTTSLAWVLLSNAHEPASGKREPCHICKVCWQLHSHAAAFTR